MNKQKRRLEREEWLKHVSRWSESGLSQAAYCRQNELRAKTLSQWVGRAPRTEEKPSQLSEPIQLVPVAPTGESPGFVLRASSGWQLDLPVSMSLSQLAALLRELV